MKCGIAKYQNKIPMYSIFYLLKGDYNPKVYPIII